MVAKNQRHLARILSDEQESRQRMIKVHWALLRNLKKRFYSESEENQRSAVPDESWALNDGNKFLPERDTDCDPSGKWKKSGERRRERRRKAGKMMRKRRRRRMSRRLHKPGQEEEEGIGQFHLDSLYMRTKSLGQLAR